MFAEINGVFGHLIQAIGLPNAYKRIGEILGIARLGRRPNRPDRAGNRHFVAQVFHLAQAVGPRRRCGHRVKGWGGIHLDRGGIHPNAQLAVFAAHHHRLGRACDGNNHLQWIVLQGGLALDRAKDQYVRSVKARGDGNPVFTQAQHHLFCGAGGGAKCQRTQQGKKRAHHINAPQAA